MRIIMEKIDKYLMQLTNKRIMGTYRPYILYTIIIILVYEFFTKLNICTEILKTIFTIFLIFGLIFLMIIKSGFVIGKKNMTNIILFIDTEKSDQEKYIDDIKENINKELMKDKIQSINVIVPPYCKRKKVSKYWMDNLKRIHNLTRQIRFRIYQKFWRGDIIFFGKIKERNQNGIKFVMDNSVLIISDAFNKIIKENQIITSIKINDDDYIVLNKEEEFKQVKDLSKFIVYLSKYSIGISHFINSKWDLAYINHKFIIENDKKKNYFPHLTDFFLIENQEIIRQHIKNRKFNCAMSYVEVLIKTNIYKNFAIQTKMLLLMYKANNILEFKENVIECFKLNRTINYDKKDRINLSIAYLELCRNNFKKAFRIYEEYFSNFKNLKIEFFKDIIEYCSYAMSKTYETNIAKLCLSCVYYYLGLKEEAKNNYNEIEEDFKNKIKK